MSSGHDSEHSVANSAISLRSNGQRKREKRKEEMNEMKARITA